MQIMEPLFFLQQTKVLIRQFLREIKLITPLYLQALLIFRETIQYQLLQQMPLHLQAKQFLLMQVHLSLCQGKRMQMHLAIRSAIQASLIIN